MSIPVEFAHLVDDAAIFPPGSSPLDAALTAHKAHRASAYADFVGPFVIDSQRLAALTSLLDGEADSSWLSISVVVPSPADLEAVIDRAAVDGLDLAGLEVKLDHSAALTPQVADIAAIVNEDVLTYVEVPRPDHPQWPEVLNAVAAAGLRLKFRTGGTSSAAFPTERELAAWIAAAVETGLPFKCTAGLHRAARHTDARTGFEHHGYLNILAATAEGAAGSDLAIIEQRLGQRDGTALAQSLREALPEMVENARERFRSYGSCSIREPLEDLWALGLIPSFDD